MLPQLCVENVGLQIYNWSTLSYNVPSLWFSIAGVRA